MRSQFKLPEYFINPSIIDNVQKPIHGSPMFSHFVRNGKAFLKTNVLFHRWTSIQRRRKTKRTRVKSYFDFFYGSIRKGRRLKRRFERLLKRRLRQQRLRFHGRFVCSWRCIPYIGFKLFFRQILSVGGFEYRQFKLLMDAGLRSLYLLRNEGAVFSSPTALIADSFSHVDNSIKQPRLFYFNFRTLTQDLTSLMCFVSRGDFFDALELNETFTEVDNRSLMWYLRVNFKRKERYKSWKFVKILDKFYRHFTHTQPWSDRMWQTHFQSVSGQRPQLNLNICDSITDRLYVKRYMRRLSRIGLRLKFERFFFFKVGQPVYIWFHSIWSLYFKRQYRWRKFEKRMVWRHMRRRTRSSVQLRPSMVRALVRSLGFLGTLSGSLHCFIHVLGFLMRRFRRHWQLFKLVKIYLTKCHSMFKTIDCCRIIIAGKFTGALRASKAVFHVGGRMKLVDFNRRTSFLLTDTHTRWGVFGIRVWVQYSQVPIFRRRGIFAEEWPDLLSRHKIFYETSRHGGDPLDGMSRDDFWKKKHLLSAREQRNPIRVARDRLEVPVRHLK